jgi:hypothetical protein
MTRSFPPRADVAIAVMTGAALLAAAATARADGIPGDASTRARIPVSTEQGVGGALETAGDVDWYRVRLVRGRDYGVRISDESYPAQLTLRDPRGRAIRTVLGGAITDQGFEHRAAVTGDHFVEVRLRPDPGGGRSASYGVKVGTDCRDAASTRCVLTLGRPYNGRTLWGYDRDRFAVRLDRSGSYSFSMTTPFEFGAVRIEVIDARGRVVAQVLAEGAAAVRGFRPAASGTHHLRVGIGADLGDRYTLLATADRGAGSTRDQGEEP